MDIFDLFRRIESDKNKSSAPVSYMIVGLGNPGEKYDKTRHNIGFMMLDALADKLGVSVRTAKFHALIGECELGGRRVVLMKPQTYMNSSGEAVGECARFYKIAPENILVLCDEISFAPGRLRIRRRGSAGGHNGLKSIIAHLSSEEFPRIKLGVGNKPTPDYDLADWVLSRFPKADLDVIAQMTPKVLSAMEEIVGGDIDGAMMRYSK
jgi:PTH1 family peptidyl-tRNA hydrolase